VNKEIHQYDDAPPVRTSAVTVANARSALNASLPVAPDDVVLSVNTPSATWLNGKAIACFQNGTGGSYVFYYTLAGR